MSTASTSSPTKSIASQPIRFPSPEKRFLSPGKRLDICAAMNNASTPPLTPTQIVIPMGFSGQLKALQETQKEQAERIVALERENAELKASQMTIRDLLARIDALEQYNFQLAARRRECVSQLLTCRPLHQDAANAFHVRSQDIQPEDLESMLSVHTNAVTMALNHQQRALGQLRSGGYGPQGPGASCPPTHYPGAPYPPGASHMRPPPMRIDYPLAYDENGKCRAHQVPYWCRICGR